MKTGADFRVLVSETVGRNSLFHHVIVEPLTFLKDNSRAQFDNVSIIFPDVTCCGRTQAGVYIWSTAERLLFQIHF